MNKSAFAIAGLVLASFVILTGTASGFPPVKDWNSVVVTLERTGCLGSCPSYRIEVHGDGTVLYDGGLFVAVTGKHRGTIPNSSVAALVDCFRKADYFSLRDRYIARITDTPTYLTSIAFDHHSKHVTDYVGRMAGMPERVAQLEEEIDKLSESERWTKGDGYTFRALADEGQDFRSPEAAAILSRIAEYGTAVAVGDFVKAGTSVEAREGFWIKNSSVGWAAERGDTEMLHALLSAHPARETLTSALSFAASGGHLDAVRLLIQNGADPAAKSDWPPIVAAAKSGSPAVVKEILQYRPDLSVRTKEGSPALVVATDRDCRTCDPKDADRPAVISMLLAAGADVNQSDSSGNTALIENGWDTRIAEILLQHGANINAQRSDGWTALFSASSPELAKFLLDHGANINIRDAKGETALESARHYSPAIAKVLEQAKKSKQ
jgi:hypothetical protein